MIPEKPGIQDSFLAPFKPLNLIREVAVVQRWCRAPADVEDVKHRVTDQTQDEGNIQMWMTLTGCFWFHGKGFKRSCATCCSLP